MKTLHSTILQILANKASVHQVNRFSLSIDESPYSDSKGLKYFQGLKFRLTTSWVTEDFKCCCRLN